MGEGAGKGLEEQAASLSAEESYLAKMRSLQFGECGGWKFLSIYLTVTFLARLNFWDYPPKIAKFKVREEKLPPKLGTRNLIPR